MDKRRVKDSSILVVLVGCATVFYSTYSLLRHWRFASSGFDLGIFDQLLWQYHRFAVPANTIRDVPNLLGDHFHPLLALLTPFYILLPRAETLLVLQALLVASSAVPVYLFAKKHLERRLVATLITISYLLFWGILQGVAYDFHEVALSVPIIAWGIYFLRNHQYGHLLVTLLLLLLVKEDQALIVAFFGILLVTQKQLLLGLGVVALSVAWFLAVTKLVIPTLSGGAYVYWSYGQLGSTATSALAWMIVNPIETLKIFLSPAIKRVTLFAMFSRFFFLPFGSSLILLAVPILAARFLSSNPNFWTTNFHYTLTLSPILVMASIEVLGRLHRYKLTFLVLPIAALLLIAQIVTLPNTPHKALFDPTFYGIPEEMQPGKRALALIPNNSRVLAQDALVPHLSAREFIYTLKAGAPERNVDYIIVSSQVASWPFANATEIESYLASTVIENFERIFSENGWVVYKRK